MEQSNTSTAKYLRAKDIAQLLGIAEITVWKWVAKDKLPQRHAKLSPKCTVWLRSDIEDYMDSVALDEVSNG